MEKKLLNSIVFKCGICESFFTVAEGAEEECQQCVENGDVSNITAISPEITEEFVILAVETLHDIADKKLNFSKADYENWGKDTLGWE